MNKNDLKNQDPNETPVSGPAQSEQIDEEVFLREDAPELQREAPYLPVKIPNLSEQGSFGGG